MSNQSLKILSTLQPQIISATARVIGNPTARANVRSNIVRATSAIKLEVSSAKTYKGVYDIEPLNIDQVLPTKDRLMTDDVTLRKVPFHIAPGVGGGYTVSIG